MPVFHFTSHELLLWSQRSYRAVNPMSAAMRPLAGSPASLRHVKYRTAYNHGSEVPLSLRQRWEKYPLPQIPRASQHGAQP